jgi:hypothetical protein
MKMTDKLRKRLGQLIQEEQKSEVDQALLSKLFELASGDPLYERFSPTQRNTLNEFFKQVRNYLFEELLTGNYGAQVIIDAVIVLTFEAGYKLKESEVQPPGVTTDGADSHTLS